MPGDAGLLGVFVGDLDHLLAALLVELGNAKADHLPSVRRIQAEGGSRIAFSTALPMPRSQTWTLSRRGSGTLMVATCLIGMGDP